MPRLNTNQKAELRNAAKKDDVQKFAEIVMYAENDSISRQFVETVILHRSKSIYNWIIATAPKSIHDGILNAGRRSAIEATVHVYGVDEADIIKQMTELAMEYGCTRNCFLEFLQVGFYKSSILLNPLVLRWMLDFIKPITTFRTLRAISGWVWHQWGPRHVAMFLEFDCLIKPPVDARYEEVLNTAYGCVKDQQLRDTIRAYGDVRGWPLIHTNSRYDPLIHLIPNEFQECVLRRCSSIVINKKLKSSAWFSPFVILNIPTQFKRDNIVRQNDSIVFFMGCVVSSTNDHKSLKLLSSKHSMQGTRRAIAAFAGYVTPWMYNGNTYLGCVCV